MPIVQLESVRLQPVAAMQGSTSLTEDGGALSTLANNPEMPLANRTTAAMCSGGREASPNWFAAYTTPRHEKAVVRQLEARHLESFLPLYSSVSRWKNGCRVVVDRPLF